MAELVKMPKMSDTMTEGVIASWQKNVGDQVKPGDILAEIETDKATMELESYEEGVLLYVGPKAGEAVVVDGVLAIIGKKGEDFASLLESDASAQPAKEVKETVEEAPASVEKIDVSGIKASVVTMPKMSDTMAEGTIASWLKKTGDSIKSGDLLAEIETDKATMELESYEDGVLLYIGAKEGEAVPVDGVIAVIGEKGADYETLLKATMQPEVNTAQPQESQPKEQATETKNAAIPSAAPTTTPVVHNTSNGRVLASPLAKKLAEEKGFDIALIPGTGENGRVIKRDVASYVPAATPTAAAAGSAPVVAGQESFEEVPVSQMRKTIARRLSDSKFTAPHFYLTMEINMDKAIEARKSLNEISPVKISFNDMVIKAVAASIRSNPDVNVSWLDNVMRKNHHIHIGVAVAVPDGLLVPVVRFADNKSLSQIAGEVKDLAKRAGEKTLQPQDWEGNTFTISNLGMFGIEEFTAIVNPPDACILAIGGIKQTAVVKDGALVPGNVMKVTLSCDHRAVDGAVGAAFLKTLKGLLEDPVRILV